MRPVMCGMSRDRALGKSKPDTLKPDTPVDAMITAHKTLLRDFTCHNSLSLQINLQ
jgi:hypothetical protein